MYKTNPKICCFKKKTNTSSTYMFMLFIWNKFITCGLCIIIIVLSCFYFIYNVLTYSNHTCEAYICKITPCVPASCNRYVTVGELESYCSTIVYCCRNTSGDMVTVCVVSYKCFWRLLIFNIKISVVCTIITYEQTYHLVLSVSVCITHRHTCTSTQVLYTGFVVGLTHG